MLSASSNFSIKSDSLNSGYRKKHGQLNLPVSLSRVTNLPVSFSHLPLALLLAFELAPSPPLLFPAFSYFVANFELVANFKPLASIALSILIICSSFSLANLSLSILCFSILLILSVACWNTCLMFELVGSNSSPF
ncbi:hypothetical protein AYI70_g10704 [Smittium culicis]|uniref:Uncharacterized protein n=1 Tax=Smittium culicis TaxID=133412 RepID=A0A1R1X5H2_9FUNG|nr:hypothetical protein AYI70_g11095 [Smittium culicis]OMJ09827.1 hypothetical protein AYI70_g10704 [Smittium culicis]